MHRKADWDFENLGGGYGVIGQDRDADGRPVFPPAGVAENRLDKIQRPASPFPPALLFRITSKPDQKVMERWSFCFMR